MIHKLRRKMIWICGTSVLAVLLIIFLAIYAPGYQQLNHNMDMMADRISEGNGVFLPFDKNHPKPPSMDRNPGFLQRKPLTPPVPLRYGPQHRAG